MKTSRSKSLVLGLCLLVALAHPSLTLAGECYSGYCYRPSYPVYYPVVQKVVEQQIVQVPQVYYQVASELRDKAIAQLTANSLLPIIGQQVQQAVKQELQGAIQGRICLELGASAGTGVSTGGGIGSYPAPGPSPGPGPSPIPPNDILTQVQSIFTQHCVKCHNPQKTDGGVDMTDIAKLDIRTVERAIHLADIGAMPKKPHPPVSDQEMEVLKQFQYQITSPQGAQAPQQQAPGYGQQYQQSQQQMPPAQPQQPAPEQPQSPPPPQPEQPAEQPENPPQASSNPVPARQATFTLRTNYEPIQILKRPRLRP